eukprot:SAG11_NODE_1825_length_4203_cov_3.238304_4_plen_156_part_00
MIAALALSFTSNVVFVRKKVLGAVGFVVATLMIARCGAYSEVCVVGSSRDSVLVERAFIDRVSCRSSSCVSFIDRVSCSCDQHFELKMISCAGVHRPKSADSCASSSSETRSKKTAMRLWARCEAFNTDHCPCCAAGIPRGRTESIVHAPSWRND